MRRYYPHGWNLVDAIRPDGKILWKSQVRDGDKVNAESRVFASLEDFKKAVKAAKIDKAAAFEVHLRMKIDRGRYQRAETILKFLREEGFKKAGPISN